ncbi:LPS export ABC transporter periplasmic protein LptC [Roseovarius sp. SCSIO 43702]|uniref:LPS export ABC transporter periplasmic protein LptC n=1 Tax=Roseovarius sp. SCSIO 43702 TaxID=2823043 RepID=UPI001C72B33E|nr:LPS export ABC transporter periplasmic protein LptC [Roseovarius sp. SCSIO 43702]QYX56951.1 LPS export ABC transporter periplasmic protein LptC [Roseovarius sp. SCSIO 43702]
MASDEFYTRLIGWLKVVLPLVALGLLSTLFLLSRKVDPTSNLPLSDVDLEQRAQDQGVSNPSFSGVTSGGEEVTFRAETVRPDPENLERVLADRVVAKFILENGTEIDVTADHGTAGRDMRDAELRGDVRVTTTTGYDLRTELLEADFETMGAEAPGQVTGTGPAGDLEAGRMKLVSEGSDGSVHLLFTDGVKLLYQPRENEE